MAEVWLKNRTPHRVRSMVVCVAAIEPEKVAIIFDTKCDGREKYCLKLGDRKFGFELIEILWERNEALFWDYGGV